ncbi:MAG: hypothetical protein MSC52_01750 [Solobacterium sp.]|nr:hypothetical protein [Solobacterium sp.]MDY5402620.1 hypothetical protein [Erysipelotrichaceae bacterium]
MTKKNENDGLDDSKTTEKKRFSDSLRGLADTLDSTLDRAGGIADKFEDVTDKISKATSKAGKVISETGSKVADQVKNVDYQELAKKTEENIKKAATVAKDKTTEIAAKAKNEVVNFMDENGNGEIDIEDVIVKGLRVPGIKINRANFLQKELLKRYPQEMIDEAIRTNPMSAGIKPKDIDEIADQVIEHERRGVSGISTALSMPGGAAMLATIPADIVQYYGYMLRATQELLYLYGFPEIDVNENESKFDSETINILIVCFGTMYGVVGANNALKSIAKGFGLGVEKKLMRTALTKGTIYPIVKSVASWFNVRMTKEIFAGFFKKSIPVIGGVIGGGLTYLSFKPCCVKLKESLQDTILSNKNYKEENGLIDIVDVEVVEKQ